MMILWTNGLLIKSWMWPMERASEAMTTFCTGLRHLDPERFNPSDGVQGFLALGGWRGGS
jgi:hypothetical protein